MTANHHSLFGNTMHATTPKESKTRNCLRSLTKLVGSDGNPNMLVKCANSAYVSNERSTAPKICPNAIIPVVKEATIAVRDFQLNIADRGLQNSVTKSMFLRFNGCFVLYGNRIVLQ